MKKILAHWDAWLMPVADMHAELQEAIAFQRGTPIRKVERQTWKLIKQAFDIRDMMLVLDAFDDETVPYKPRRKTRPS